MSSFRDSIRDSNGGAYLLYFGSFLYFMLVAAVAADAIGIHGGTLVGEFVGILGAALIWRWWIAGDAAAPWPSFELGVHPVVLLTIVLAVVSLGFLANGIGALLIELSPSMKEIAQSYSQQISELILDATGLERVLGILGVCVAAPLCEEALFRGTILGEQRKKESVAVAVVINGVLFSAYHVNPISAIGLAFLGMFLAHITIRSGSLVPAIIAHAAINTTNAVILPEIFPQAADTDVPLEMSGIILVIAIMATSSAFFWWLSMHLMEKAGD